MTSKRSSSTHHTMMSSSTEASASSSRWVYWARPGPILPRSLVSAACRRSKRVGALDPHGAEVADVEHDRAGRGRPGARRSCPSGTDSGMSQPPKGTSLAPEGAVDGVERRGAVGVTPASPTRLLAPVTVVGRPSLRPPRPRRPSRGARRWRASTSLLHAAEGQEVEHALALRFTTSISSSPSRTSTTLSPRDHEVGARRRPRRGGRAGSSKTSRTDSSLMPASSSVLIDLELEQVAVGVPAAAAAARWRRPATGRTRSVRAQ